MKYEVKMKRTKTYYAIVEVEAVDERQARAKACREGREDDNIWCDPDQGRASVIRVNAVKE